VIEIGRWNWDRGSFVVQTWWEGGFFVRLGMQVQRYLESKANTRVDASHRRRRMDAASKLWEPVIQYGSFSDFLLYIYHCFLSGES